MYQIILTIQISSEKMSLASLSEPSHTPIINSHGEGKHPGPDRNTTPMWDMVLHF